MGEHERMRFVEDDTDAMFMAPGTWRRTIVEGIKGTAYVACPKCGVMFSLHHYAIAPSGAVADAVSCPSNACDWRRWSVLVRW